MNVFHIKSKIDNLASGIEHEQFLYDELINLNQDRAFLATQVALAHCYKYEFNFKLAQKAKLFGNTKFYQLRARLEQDLQKFIQEKFFIGLTPWDISKPSEEYVDYILGLIRNHSCFQHKFFAEFFVHDATYEDFRFYLAQESAPRFDDLLAMIQVGMPVQMKMELAKNYWDEMGNADFNKVHASMFMKVLKYFNVNAEYASEKVLLPSIISDNLSAMLAIYRENYAHAIGFLAVTEYCVPIRFKCFIEGCRRLGIEDDVLSYHILHTDIDGEHSEGWFREIVIPLVRGNPSIADKITEGVLLKLNSSQYFFDALLEKLSCSSVTS